MIIATTFGQLGPEHLQEVVPWSASRDAADALHRLADGYVS